MMKRKIHIAIISISTVCLLLSGCSDASDTSGSSSNAESSRQAQSARKINYYDADHNLDWYIIYTSENGKETSAVSYDASGKQTSIIKYKYNNSGNLICSAVPFEKDKKLGKAIYEYQTGEKAAARFSVYSPNGALSSTQETLKWDEHGNKAEAKTVSYDNGQSSSETETSYKYDDRHRLTEVVDSQIDPSGKLKNGSSNKVIFSYDDQKHTCTQKNYSIDGKLNETVVTTYDDNGNETHVSIYDANGKAISGAAGSD